MTIAERVANGAAFLDEHDPGWWRPDVDRAINLETLNLGDSDLCVLGQRCPLARLASHSGYRAYAAHLMGAKAANLDPIWAWAKPRGFATANYSEYPALTAEWKRVITARREAS